ncbi:MAG: alpha/beta hydrolase family protein [Gammaproteobacteria bacterium]
MHHAYRYRNALIAITLSIVAGAGCQTPAPRTQLDPVFMDPATVDPAYPPAMEPVVIRSQGAKLSGIVYVAQGPGPHPAVILLHGYPGNERNLDLAHAIRRAGWNLLFFHYRGSWGSEGRFSIAHAIADTHAAVAFTRSAEFIRKYRTDPARLAVIGHSMGGYIAFEATAEDSSLRCAASLAGANLGKFGELAQQSAEFASQLAYYIDDANAIVGDAGQAAVARWMAHAPDYDLRRLVPKLAGKSLLLLGAEGDTIVPLDQHHEPLAEALRKSGHGDLTVETLDSDHVFSSRRIALAHIVINWLNNRCKQPLADG